MTVSKEHDRHTGNRHWTGILSSGEQDDDDDVSGEKSPYGA
jgi:hypothetical protein